MNKLEMYFLGVIVGTATTTFYIFALYIGGFIGIKIKSAFKDFKDNCYYQKEDKKANKNN